MGTCYRPSWSNEVNDPCYCDDPVVKEGAPCPCDECKHWWTVIEVPED